MGNATEELKNRLTILPTLYIMTVLLKQWKNIVFNKNEQKQSSIVILVQEVKIMDNKCSKYEGLFVFQIKKL